MRFLTLLYVLVTIVTLAGCQTTSTTPEVTESASNSTVWVLITDPPIVLEQGKRVEGFQSNAADYAVKGGLTVAALPVGLGLQLGLSVVEFLIEVERDARTVEDIKPLKAALTRDVMTNLIVTQLKQIESMFGADIRVLHSTRKFERLFKASLKLDRRPRFVTPTLSISRDYRSLQLNISIRGEQQIDYTTFSKDLQTTFVSQSIAHWKNDDLAQIRSFVSAHLAQAFSILSANALTSLPYETLSFELQGETVTTQSKVLAKNKNEIMFKDKQGRIFSVPL